MPPLKVWGFIFQSVTPQTSQPLYPYSSHLYFFYQSSNIFTLLLLIYSAITLYFVETFIDTGQSYYPINWWQWLDNNWTKECEQVSQSEIFPGILNTSNNRLRGEKLSFFSELTKLGWFSLFEVIACSTSYDQRLCMIGKTQIT